MFMVCINTVACLHLSPQETLLDATSPHEADATRTMSHDRMLAQILREELAEKKERLMQQIAQANSVGATTSAGGDVSKQQQSEDPVKETEQNEKEAKSPTVSTAKPTFMSWFG